MPLVVAYGTVIEASQASLGVDKLRVSRTGLEMLHEGPPLPRGEVVTHDASGLVREQMSLEGNRYRSKRQRLATILLHLGHSSGHSVGDYGNFWTADTYTIN